MIDYGKRNLLGIRIDAVDYEAAVNKVIAGASTGQPMAVSALAVHGVMTGVLDAVHRYRLNAFDLLVPDGQPVRLAVNRLYGLDLADRVYGPNLMLEICRRAAAEGLPVFLFGSSSETLVPLRKNLETKFPDLIVAGAQPSKFRRISPAEGEALALTIQESGAAITFVGLGCPRQEVWTYEFYRRLSMPTIAVGAAFPFHAGILPQAPKIMQDYSLEWFYRLAKEPRRLWKRYLLLNPHYLYLVLNQLTGRRTFDPQNAIAPTEDILYG